MKHASSGPTPHRLLVSLGKDQEEADHDFELTWTLDAGAAPQAALFTETVGDRDYALLMVLPPAPDAAEPRRCSACRAR